MDELIIKGTEFSPEVIFSPSNRQYRISGWSRPESPSKFYEPIFNWIEKQGAKHLHHATINFQLEYFNTSSAKMLRDLFRKLDTLYNNGVKMNIVWHYDEIESKEEFEYEFAQELSFPIQYIATPQ